MFFAIEETSFHDVGPVDGLAIVLANKASIVTIHIDLVRLRIFIRNT